MYGAMQMAINNFAMNICKGKCIIKKWLEGTPKEARLIAFVIHEKYTEEGEIFADTWTTIVLNELDGETHIKSYHGDGKTKKPKGYAKQELAREIKRWNYLTIGQEGYYRIPEAVMNEITTEEEITETGTKEE